MPNPLKADPSRTTMLRRQFYADIKRRMASIERDNRELIVDDDALGLQQEMNVIVMHQQVDRQIWRFQTNKQKIASYRKWLTDRVNAGLLTTDAIDPTKPWNATYIESAYQKGVVRAYAETHRLDAVKGGLFYDGGRVRFLLEAFAAPQLISKIETLYIRAFNELNGISASMSQQMSRVLADGLANGWAPRKIAREMSNQIQGLSRTRALLIAHTEIIRAQAEGQLDGMRLLGVKEVGLMAEWQTAGDERVCPECGELEGTVISIDDASGLIPRHPRCRCAWAPVSTYLPQEQQQKWGRDASDAIRSSIEVENPNKSYRTAKRQSVWAGKQLV